MNWRGHERLSDSKAKDPCCEVYSHDDYMNERRKALEAQRTTASVGTGFEGEAMNPEENIGLKKWDGK